MLMLSRSDMIWTMPVLRCHFQIEAIQMKLRWQEKIVLLPSGWCTMVEVDPTSKKLLCHPDTRSKNGFGAKNSKFFKPFWPYPPLPRVTEQHPGPPLDFSIMENITFFLKKKEEKIYSLKWTSTITIELFSSLERYSLGKTRQSSLFLMSGKRLNPGDRSVWSLISFFSLIHNKKLLKEGFVLTINKICFFTSSKVIKGVEKPLFVKS